MPHSHRCEDTLRTELFDGAVAAAVRTLLGTDEPARKTALRLLSIAVNYGKVLGFIEGCAYRRAEDLRTWVFEDTTIAAMKPAIADMLGSNTGSMNNTGSASEIAAQLLFLCANYGKPVDWRYATCSHAFRGPQNKDI
jgi:hypothetical protein